MRAERSGKPATTTKRKFPLSLQPKPDLQIVAYARSPHLLAHKLQSWFSVSLKPKSESAGNLRMARRRRSLFRPTDHRERVEHGQLTCTSSAAVITWLLDRHSEASSE